MGGSAPGDENNEGGTAAGSGLATGTPSLRGWAVLNGTPGPAQNDDGAMLPARRPQDAVADDMLDAANTLNVLSSGGKGAVPDPEGGTTATVESAPAVSTLPAHLPQPALPTPSHLFCSPISQATLTQLLLLPSPLDVAPPPSGAGMDATTATLQNQSLQQTGLNPDDDIGLHPEAQAVATGAGALMEPVGLDEDVAAAFSGL